MSELFSGFRERHCPGHVSCSQRQRRQTLLWIVSIDVMLRPKTFLDDESHGLSTLLRCFLGEGWITLRRAMVRCAVLCCVSPSSCLDGASRWWVPVNTHGTPAPSKTGGRGQPRRLTKPPSTTGSRQEHDPHQHFIIMVAEQR